MAKADIWTPSEEWVLEDFGGLKAYSPKDILSRTGHNIVLYGKGGSGKTTLAATVRHCKYGRRVLHLDASGNAHVLAHDPNYKVIPITQWAQVAKFTSEAKNTRDLPFDCVVFDNLSEMQTMNMLQYAPPGMEEIQHWRRNTADIIAFVHTWKDLTRVRPVSVIFIAWDEAETNEQGAVVKTRLKFTKSLKDTVPGIVDNVGYVSVESDGRTRKLSFNQYKTDSKLSVAHHEAAHQIPMDMWYTDQPLLADIFNTVIGGEPFPRESYKKGV